MVNTTIQDFVVISQTIAKTKRFLILNMVAGCQLGLIKF